MEIRRCVNCMEEITDEVCPYCGYSASEEEQVSYGLKRNSILHGRYLIGNVLGQGGFGITYIGFDMMLNIKVAIKEYYPMGYVSRNCTQSNRIVWSTTKAGAATPQKGCDEFLKEARRMAQIDVLPEIVRVRDTFMDNNTAYIVMDYVQGQTLKSYLLQNGVMGFSECVNMFLPLMHSLAEVHKRGLVHRDISPDNIMVQSDGRLRLLDLGAAKELDLNSNGNSQLVTKKGFSPAEQCLEGGMIGTWTDIYALCATIYYCITGKVAPASMERLASDKDPLSFDMQMKEPLGERAKSVLRKGLEIKSGNRTQTVEELVEGLKKAVGESSPTNDDVHKKGIGKKIMIGCVAALVVLFLVIKVSGGSSGNDSDDLAVANSLETVENTTSESASEVVIDTESQTEPDTAIPDETIYDYTQNVLMQETVVQAEDEDKWVLGKEGLNRSSIVSINFVDSFKEMPDDAWDVSRDKNGKVMAWTVSADDGLYHLFIAGNGGVMADNCNSQFAHYDNVRQILFNECFHTEQVSSAYAMFYWCEKLEHMELEQLDTSNVENMGFMFCGCSSLGQLDLSGFQTDKSTNMECMFGSCTSLQAIDVSSFQTGNVEKMNAMFYQCSSLEEIDVSGFDTGKVTTMKHMFAGCNSLNSLKMHKLNTAHVEDMQYMFADCSRIRDIELSINTSRVTNMQGMFYGCSALEQADLSSFITSSVTDMSFMFHDCGALRELNISTFDTGSVTTMGAMFQMCSSLAELDLSSFNTQNVTDMGYMFYGCSNLKELDLGGFDTSQVTKRDNMFTNTQITEEKAGLK